jgi:hypothetical protein
VKKRLIIQAAALIAVPSMFAAALLSAQDPFPQVPPGVYQPNGQANGYYPGSGPQRAAMPYQPLTPTRSNDFPGGPVPPMNRANGSEIATWQSGPQPVYGPVPASYAGPALPPAQVMPPRPAQLCAGTIILARVGNDVVLTSDLPAVIDEMLGNLKQKKIPAEKIAEQRAAMIKELSEAVDELAAHLNDPDPVKGMSMPHRSFVNNLVHRQTEIKLLYQDFRATVPKENLPAVEETVARRFEEYQLKALLEREGVSNRADLETSLQAKGSSLEREKRIFKEQFLAQTWLQQSVLENKKEGEEEVTHEEMLKWYQEHLKKFESPPQVRWEELMISFARHPNRGEAYAAMAALGNRVLAGASLADVARNASEGPTAHSGGLRDWTHMGSLSSDVLDHAIFNRPVGTLSEIIETPEGYHIIRVIERQELIQKSFLEVQKEIKENIKNERLDKRYKDFVAKVKGKYPVWTVFDNSMQQPPEEKDSPEEEDRYSKR